MAFLQIKSDNPQLSYILRKNPASGLFARTLHKGTLFGYFSENDLSTYNIYFQDAFNDISYPEYKDQEFEYINTTRYSSTQFIINALSDVARDAMNLKKRNPEIDPDDLYTNTIIVNLIYLENKRTLSAFLQHFSSICSIDVEQVADKYFRLTLTTRKSLFYLFNLLNLFSAFVVMRNETEYIALSEDNVERYFTSLSVIDAPYFIRYGFKVELLKSKRLFEKYKASLESSNACGKMVFLYGDTLEMRKNTIEQNIDFKHHVVDLGCGEGNYVVAFAKSLISNEKTYFAIDQNEHCRYLAMKRAKAKNITNLIVQESLEQFLSTPVSGNVDFILGEVIEHMELVDAASIVRSCLEYPSCNKVIITTPNADFNRHYFDEGMRHPDHKFEFTKNEFMSWLNETVGVQYDVAYLDIGDMVDEISVSVGAVITKRGG